MNTIVIGMVLPLKDVALWGIAFTLIGAAQGIYGPILNSAYLHMLTNKNRFFLQKILLFMMPLILIAAVGTYILAPWIITVIGGSKYVEAVPVLRALLPMLVISFPAMLFGWPALDAIGKSKQTTISTIVAACIQLVGIGILYATHNFTLIGVALLRFVSELSIFILRFRYFMLFKNEYTS